jgi:hypothetical protein
MQSPFSDTISHPGAKFYEPAIRVGIEFQDMRDDRYLRHAAFKRFADELTWPAIKSQTLVAIWSHAL